jgi:hypothetical protein
MTFVIFGLVQAILLLFEYFTKSIREKIQSKISENIYQRISIALTFLVISICFILFRAEDMKMVSSIGTEILNWDGMLLKQYVAEKNLSKLLGIATLILLFVVFEEKMEQTMKQVGLSRWIQMLIVSTLLILIGVAGVLGKEEFIYFQF